MTSPTLKIINNINVTNTIKQHKRYIYKKNDVKGKSRYANNNNIANDNNNIIVETVDTAIKQ